MSQQPRPERSRNIVPPPIPPRPSRRFIEYLIGLALGAIPMSLALLAFGGLATQLSSSFLTMAIGLYFISLIAAISCLVSPRSRFIGYGLLTMFFVTPIVAYIACVASIRTCGLHGCIQ